MKKYYFLIVGFLFFGIGNAQIVNIPDANFKAKLLSATPTNGIAKNLEGNYFKIDANNDGQVQQSEALNVSYLDVNFYNSSNLYKISNLSGIEYFVNLTKLICHNNLLVNINMTNNVALTYLDCSFNNIVTINISNNTALTYLQCGFNQISDLNLNNNNLLVELDFSGYLSNGINLNNNTSLKKLVCSSSQLTTLSLSNNLELEGLYCYYNSLLTEINISNNISLKSLFCYYNHLTNLNVDNNIALITLLCYNNQLSNLNVNNNTQLLFLECDNNQLNSLNLEFNTELYRLDCSDNQLENLDLNNTKIEILYCYSNLLKTLLTKTGRIIIVLDFGMNPSLEYICTDENQFVAFQNKINSYGYSATCHLNSYCSFTPGGTFYTITGKNRYDSNNNGCEATDVAIPNFKLSITDTSLITGNAIPDLTGNYSLPLQTGTYLLTPVIENSAYFTVSPTSATITLPENINPYIQDFCITPIGVHDDLEVSVFPVELARPGFDATYKIIYKNKGTYSQSGNLNFVYDDAVLDLVSVLPTFTSQTINNLSWDYSNLLPFESREVLITLNVNAPTEIPAVNNNDILTYNVSINGLVDETPFDNISTLNQTVVNSFDPNDKTCLEGATITPSQVGKEVHYIIRFENTGTANAQNIVVKDMIDTAKFDVNSLIPMGGSHSFITRITNTNKVEFIFENIQLPFDDANNDGYVAFKIKTKPTLVLGNTFSNTASIYFDYNFPIETNTATTIISNQLAFADFEFTNYISISPNPAKETLNVNIKDIEVSSISIYNTLGQLVQVIPNAKITKVIDVSTLKTGNYFIKVVSNKGSISSKFIKE